MTLSRRWTAEDIPDLWAKTVIVTGANSGLGFEAASILAQNGAHVVLACRNSEKAKAAMDRVLEVHPEASLQQLPLDLADLASVRAFAEAFLHAHQALHVLINNAGVMGLPRRTTADGFEMQFGTNHLGHFALTGWLLDRLLQTPGARVVSVSSFVHRMGKIRFQDLNWEKRYRKWAAYAQSKLANLLFTSELDRRVRAKGADLAAVCSHPGYSATNLQLEGPRMQGAKLREWLMGFANQCFAQSACKGALSLVCAAVEPEVRGGDYIGPSIAELWGNPANARSSARARSREDALRLWQISEELTGVRYTALE